MGQMLLNSKTNALLKKASKQSGLLTFMLEILLEEIYPKTFSKCYKVSVQYILTLTVSCLTWIIKYLLTQKNSKKIQYLILCSPATIFLKCISQARTQEINKSSCLLNLSMIPNLKSQTLSSQNLMYGLTSLLLQSTSELNFFNSLTKCKDGMTLPNANSKVLPLIFQYLTTIC